MAEAIDHRWAVRLPTGEQVKLVDLPWSTVTAAADDLGVSWAALVDRPLDGTGVLARAAYRVACLAHGLKKPASLTTREMSAVFEAVPDGPSQKVPEGDLQWLVTLPDGLEVKLWDVEFGVIEKLATARNMAWSDLLDRPLTGSGATATAVYETLCKEFGQEPDPDLTARRIIEIFRMVPNDKPEFEGPAADPKAVTTKG